MFRRLLGKLLGDFPPKNANLCDKCRTSYTVTGIIKPPMSYDQLVEYLYSHGLLCINPCGVMSNTALTPPPPEYFQLDTVLQDHGISCGRCRTAFLTGMAFDFDIAKTMPALIEKDIVCRSCMMLFSQNFRAIYLEVASLLHSIHENL